MAGVLQHLRSSTLDKRPNPASMVDGQVAINYASGSPGMFFKDSNGDLVKVGPVHVGSTAPNVSPASGGTAGNSKGEQWLDTSGGTYVFKIWDGAAWRSEAGEFVNSTGDTMTGSLTMGQSADIIFEGSVDDGFETTLTVANPTADRTITLPDVTGIVVTTGDSGSVTSAMIANGTIVDADVNASAAIAGTKISPDFGSQNVVTTGTSTAASFIPTSSSVPTNGVYLPSANNVAISTNSVGRLFVDSSGNVGIGTGATAPSHSLTVQGGSVTESQLSLTTNAASILVGNIVGGIDFRSNDNNGIFTAAKIQAIADASHNVGAGFVATSLVFSNNAERLRITSTGELKHIGGGTEGDPAVYFAGSAPAKSLYVEATTGHVGLGTSSVDAKLHVQGTSGTYPTSIINHSAIDVEGEVLRIGRTDSVARYHSIYGKQSATNSSNYLQFRVHDGSASSPFTSQSTVMTLTGQGRVGVGTTDPQTITHVFGADPILRIQDSSTSISDGFAAIQLAESATGGSLHNYWQIALEHDIGTGADHLTFKDITSERMRIDSSGRLLVGTSSTSAAVSALLQGNSSNTASNSAINLARGQTSFSSGSYLGRITFSDSAHGIAADIGAQSDGTWTSGTSQPTRLVFSTTADGASSPTERMRIGQDGSVSIYSGGFARFKVSGNAFFDTQNGIGITFGTNSILPADQTGALTDNTKNIGNAANRWATIYAGTGTINTSDANLKQDIADLEQAELNVATAIKGLIKKFRFIDAVANKGDDARIHVGVIAQDIEQAFVAEGLDPRRYALFCEDTLEDGSKRLGIRYDELLAFVIAVL